MTKIDEVQPDEYRRFYVAGGDFYILHVYGAGELLSTMGMCASHQACQCQGRWLYSGNTLLSWDQIDQLPFSEL